MPRRYGIAALILFAGLLCFALGCGDDDEASPTGPGGTSLDDQYAMFSGEFSGVDEATGEMLGLVFMHIEDISSAASANGRAFDTRAAATIDYHSDTKFWVITDTFIDFDTISIVDSLQFIAGNDTVQWPDEQSTTELRSFMTLHYASDVITAGELHQNLVLTTTDPLSDTVFANGSGSAIGDLIDSIAEGPDSVVCNTYMDVTWTVANLAMDMSGYSGGPPCPYAGTLTFTADVDISCAGTMTGATSGIWTVTLTFLQGQMNWLYEKDGSSWPESGSCN